MAGRFQWKGHEFPFDITDARCIARIAEAVRRVKAGIPAKSAPEVPGGGLDALASDAARYCALVEAFFAALFGEEAVLTLFGGRQSLEEHGSAWASFTAYAAGELERLDTARREAEERYGSMADTLGVLGFDLPGEAG